MNPEQSPWTRVPSACTDATRVLFMTSMGSDTFLVEDGGEVSLVDSDTLKQLITQLGRGGQA